MTSAQQAALTKAGLTPDQIAELKQIEKAMRSAGWCNGSMGGIHKYFDGKDPDQRRQMLSYIRDQAANLLGDQAPPRPMSALN